MRRKRFRQEHFSHTGPPHAHWESTPNAQIQSGQQNLPSHWLFVATCWTLCSVLHMTRQQKKFFNK